MLTIQSLDGNTPYHSADLDDTHLQNALARISPLIEPNDQGVWRFPTLPDSVSNSSEIQEASAAFHAGAPEKNENKDVAGIAQWPSGPEEPHV